MGKEFKDDINKETAVMGRTHGPLGLQRLTFLTESPRFSFLTEEQEGHPGDHQIEMIVMIEMSLSGIFETISSFLFFLHYRSVF